MFHSGILFCFVLFCLWVWLWWRWWVFFIYIRIPCVGVNFMRKTIHWFHRAIYIASRDTYYQQNKTKKKMSTIYWFDNNKIQTSVHIVFDDGYKKRLWWWWWRWNRIIIRINFIISMMIATIHSFEFEFEFHQTTMNFLRFLEICILCIPFVLFILCHWIIIYKETWVNEKKEMKK